MVTSEGCFSASRASAASKTTALIRALRPPGRGFGMLHLLVTNAKIFAFSDTLLQDVSTSRSQQAMETSDASTHPFEQRYWYGRNRRGLLCRGRCRGDAVTT